MGHTGVTSALPKVLYVIPVTKQDILQKLCFSKKRKEGINQIVSESTANASESSDSEYLFMGPILATPIDSNVNMVSSKEKALLNIKVSAKKNGCQKSVLCKIDSGAETSIVPKPLYDILYPKGNKLMKPTVVLTAYGGTEIPNLGSCQMYVQGPHNPTPKQITVKVVNVDGPVVIGNATAQELNLLKLNWPVKATHEHMKVYGVNGKGHPTH